MAYSRVKMFSLAQVLISVALLSPVILALPVTEDSVIDGSSEDSNRLENGHNAVEGQFPYSVYVRELNFNNKWTHRCGGSIISPNFVLTAARCETRGLIIKLQVVVGSIRYKIEEETGTYNRDAYDMRQFIKHENYSAPRGNSEPFPDEKLRYDIALFETTKPIQFNKLVAPIALQRGFIDADIRAVFSGWGEYVVSFFICIK